MTNIHYIYKTIHYIIILRGDNMFISIVGLSGSGKSSVANLICLKNKNIVHLDIDKVGHQSLLDPVIKKKLVSTFGLSIIEKNEINRKKLSHIVFSSPEVMNKLTEITWNYMEEYIDNFIKKNQNKIIILDWILLPKTKYFKESNLRILVTAPSEIRIKRVLKRDNLTKEQFNLRDNSKPPINQSDYNYIINNINLNDTKKKVDELYDKSIIHREF